MKTSISLSTAILVALVPQFVFANPVTIVGRGTINHIENVFGESDDCCAVDPARLPFGDGDEIRIVFTYETTAGATGGGASGWSSTDAVKVATISVGGFKGTVSSGLISIADLSSYSFLNFESKLAEYPEFWDYRAPVGGGFPHFRLFYSAQPGCFSGPSLLAGLPDSNTCPPSVGSMLVFYIDGLNLDADGNYIQGPPNLHNLQLVRLEARASGSGEIHFEQASEAATVGSNVVVAPNFAGGGMVMTFQNVTEPGDVNIIVVGSSDPEVPQPPSAFDFGGLLFDVVTSAQFSGGVEICAPWSGPNDVEPSMLHYTNGSWEELPITRSGSGVLCATTTSFSLFAVVVPGAAQRNLQTLVTAIINLNLKKGLANSLDAKLAAAKQALADMKDNNDVAARGSVNSLINEVAAQRGKGLTLAEADSLTALANSVLNKL